MIFRFNDFRSGHYKEWLGRFQVAQYSVAFRDMHHVNNVWRECASRFEARLQVVETSVENTEKKWCWINELFGHMNMYGQFTVICCPLTRVRTRSEEATYPS